MSLTTQLPARRSELLLQPLGGGRYVVKDRESGDFFQVGEEEHFLLQRLDGEHSREDMQREFEGRFDEPLSDEDLDDFIDAVREQGLLAGAERGTRNAEQNDSAPYSAPRSPRSKQSILYWRKSLWDPDRFFEWLEPKIRFFWTGGFLFVSAACILLAAFLVWANAAAAAASVQNLFRWETAFWAWLILLGVTTLHECAHGLTCKHYGGEVHEIGFLLMFFMPCFYCNVSDAWLFREKRKRLWVTFAGGYFELFLWALAVFLWRITVPGTMPHYLAFVVVVSCGIQSFFNFNPLIKLDGYYLLSDWLEIPNLRQRGLGLIKAHLRRLLWGAERPPETERGRVLAGFGIASWVYSILFLSLMLVALSRFLGDRWGPVGLSAVAVLGVVSLRGMFRGVSNGEATTMILKRHKRTVLWLTFLGSLGAFLVFFEIDDRVGGPCEIRSAARAEVRAPVAGFIGEVYVEQGDFVSPGMPVARLDIPDLQSRLARKEAEVREAQAELKLLEAGPRPETIAEQRRAVERAEAWCDLARKDLEQVREAHTEKLARLDEKISECRAEFDAAQEQFTRAELLRKRKAISDDKFQQARRKRDVCRARLAQAEADAKSHSATGTLEAEAELARREQALADIRSELTLLEAGSRPEEIDAARAHLDRVQEDLRYLKSLRKKLSLHCSIPGVVTTENMAEQVRRHVQEGELVCTVEETAALQVKVALPEEAIERIEVGQLVRLKARGYPFQTFRTRVERIAPAAVEKSAKPAQAASLETPRTVPVYCRLETEKTPLRPGMTGYARIHTGPRSIGGILCDRVIRFLRTEFWW